MLDAETARRMYIEEQRSTLEIAALMNVSPSTVCNRLREAGVAGRPSGGVRIRRRIINGEVVQLTLQNGMVALLDAADAHFLDGYGWHAFKSFKLWYVRGRPSRIAGRPQPPIFLHQLLLPCPAGREPDHINGNGLDNRRENLRIATRSLNCANRRKFSARPTSSRFKGVKKHLAGGWAMACQYKGRRITSYWRPDQEEAAARAYDAAALELFGPFARLNFPTTRVEESA